MTDFRKLLKGATIEGTVRVRCRSGKLLTVSLHGTLVEVRNRFWRLHRKHHFRKVIYPINVQYVEPSIKVFSRKGLCIAHFISDKSLAAFIIWLRSVKPHID